MSTPLSTPQPQPAVSIVIAVYNKADFLELVFTSLLDQTCRDFEVVVADDGSGQEIAGVIRRMQDRFQFPIQHIWHEDQGFRKTIIVNRAALAARADYLLFIDGDCILHHRFVERHLLRKRPGQVLSGRRVRLLPDVTQRLSALDISSRRIQKVPFWWNGCIPTSRRHGFYLPWLFAVKNIARTRYEILGCNFSVYKKDFLEINGYDERIIGRGLEDNNLCSRFIMGGKVLRSVATEAVQYHLHHSFDPVPHSAQTIHSYQHPDQARTPFGLIKDPDPAAH